MNTDSNPPLPQNETAVAVSLANPKIAVAAGNDYVSGGNIVMRTADGGRNWKSTRVTPSFGGTGDVCSGGDPSVAYSRRDHVFYMGQLCFFRTLPFSEVQVYVSRDNGKTWTPGRAAARAATNFNYTTGTVDTSTFNDKDYIAVDNTPTSPHYGRLYVGYTKFHMLPSGFSDYCPLQLSYTDSVNMANPSLTTFQHTAIQPDNPGGNGTGGSANQYFTPQVERERRPGRGLHVRELQQLLRPARAVPAVHRRRPVVPAARRPGGQARPVHGLPRRRQGRHPAAHQLPGTQHARRWPTTRHTGR